MEKAHPVELFLNRINALKMQMHQDDAYEKERVEENARYKAQLEAMKTLPTLNGSHEIWEECLDKLELEILPDSFKTFIKPIKYLGMAGGVAYIELPNELFKKQILNHFIKLIKSNIGHGILGCQCLLAGDYKLND